jgi:hypothetical protein
MALPVLGAEGWGLSSCPRVWEGGLCCDQSKMRLSQDRATSWYTLEPVKLAQQAEGPGERGAAP